MVLGSTLSMIEPVKQGDSFFTKFILGVIMLCLFGLLWAIFGQDRPQKPVLHAAQQNVHFDSPEDAAKP